MDWPRSIERMNMLPPPNQILLCAFLFSVGMGIGGGLYETRAVYPNWSYEPSPNELSKKLASSGQAAAGRRYWPLISPASALLAVLNVFLAWHQAGMVRDLWLMSSIAIVLKSMGTYGYFVPTFVRRIARPEGMDTLALRQVVRTWTRLSPLRILVETFAWITGIWALLLAAKG
jgi:hypothetical protein